jgi:serine/threonine-protein kinase HipA
MSINGKRDDFTVADLRRAGAVAGLKRGAATRILGEVTAAVKRWPELAADAGIPKETIALIRGNQRLDLPRD